MTHTAFTSLDATRRERDRGVHGDLREFSRVTSFRAPYLRFPDEYVEILERSRLRARFVAG